MLPVPWREPDTVPLLNATPFHAFPLCWQLQPPQDAMIVVVKATFDLVQGGPARLAEEQLLPSGEEPFADAESPECLRYPGDMAYFKPLADLFLVGRAYPPATGFAVTLVRFAVGGAVETAVAVVGDRRWTSSVPSQPAHFESIELRADRAFGGPKVEANPIGLGHGAVEGAPLPNIERHDRVIRQAGDTPTPAFTTPIPSTWKARRRHAGSYDSSWVKRAPYFPADFDWRFFNAAPEEMQAPYLRGDEPYWIQGMDPAGTLLEGRLPGVVPRVFGLPAASPDQLRELPMNLDTVWFDVEAKQVVLAWRGAISTADAVGSDLAAFFVRAEPVGQPSPAEVLHAAYAEEYDKRYVRPFESDAEEEEPAPLPEPLPPGRAAPQGLTPEKARALGLPPSAATVHLEDDVAEEPPPPPAPEPARTRAEIETQVSGGGPLDDADLSRGDLSQLDLRGRSLVGADLTGAQLAGVLLGGASLAGALMSEAQAEGVDFSGVDMRGADLEGANLTGANFQGADLTEANLSRALCAGCDFGGAKLDELIASETDFAGCRFDGATAHSADLTGSRLERASMVGLQAEDLRLYEVHGPGLIADDSKLPRLRADGARLMGSSFQRVEAPDSSIRAVDLTQADWRKATLDESVFDDSNLDRALFSQVEATACRWPRARAPEASFLKANLMEGHFEGACFDRADLRGANLYNSDTFRATFLGADLTGAILGNSGLG